MKVMAVYTKCAETYRFGEESRGKPSIARASDINFLGQLHLPQDCKIAQRFFADIANARKGDEIAKARVRSFLNQIEFSKEEIITLKKGVYKKLGRKRSNNPRHKVELERDYHILPLNMGILQQFAGNELTDSLLKRVEGSESDRRTDWYRLMVTARLIDKASIKNLVVNYPSVRDSLDLPVVMNPALISSRWRLRPISEPLAEVFISAYREVSRIFVRRHIITASYYDEEGVNERVLEIDLVRENLKNSDRFVFRSVSDPYLRFPKSPFDTAEENCILFELVPLKSSLFLSPGRPDLTKEVEY